MLSTVILIPLGDAFGIRRYAPQNDKDRSLSLHHVILSPASARLVQNDKFETVCKEQILKQFLLTVY